MVTSPYATRRRSKSRTTTPTPRTSRHVREALSDKGISVDGGWTDSTASADTLATLTSPPLSEILKALMKPSQNQIAEMLFRTIAIGKPADSARAAVGRQIAPGASRCRRKR